MFEKKPLLGLQAHRGLQAHQALVDSDFFANLVCLLFSSSESLNLEGYKPEAISILIVWVYWAHLVKIIKEILLKK